MNAKGLADKYSLMQVVLASQKAFLFNQEEASNEAFFNRLLGPLTAQLAADLPEHIRAREVDDSSLPASSGGLDSTDAIGMAVVGALVQMGASSGGENLLKPLHHQVMP